MTEQRDPTPEEVETMIDFQTTDIAKRLSGFIVAEIANGVSHQGFPIFKAMGFVAADFAHKMRVKNTVEYAHAAMSETFKDGMDLYLTQVERLRANGSLR
jgi:hypothetical protein